MAAFIKFFEENPMVCILLFTSWTSGLGYIVSGNKPLFDGACTLMFVAVLAYAFTR